MKFFQINDMTLLSDNRRILYDLEKNLRINLHGDSHIQKKNTVIKKYRILYDDLETKLFNSLSWRVYVHSLNK